MELQISYNSTNLSQALEIAKKTAPFADTLEIGTPLLLSHGINAISEFRKNFPSKKIFADAKIVDRVSDIIPVLCKAGASSITVLYGTSNKVIQKAAKAAHDNNAKIVLDLIDPDTMSQAALDAESLNVDYLLFHYPHETDQTISHLEEWESVKGNTSLPVFIAGRIKKNDIKEILKLKPRRIIIGEAITEADDPEAAAKEIRELISGN
jgi:3-hexulose-6-phosphate synthase